QRSQIGPLRRIDRRRNGNNEEVAAFERGRIAAAGELLRRLQRSAIELARPIVEGAQFLDTALAYVEADRRHLASEVDGQWQAHIAKADHRDLDVIELGQHHRRDPCDFSDTRLLCAFARTTSAFGSPASIRCAADIRADGTRPQLTILTWKCL